ncbi:hypothetical protein PhCBS80983_g00945 [Powellomyces hirtus]|uniref:Uncharacterized protein n=1 Tax=Powellomyces hirtus TaxID=109895 RepID=A0A507ECV8_9FUNG|nr:hypothetical protein PhCBS80983_g00945 [Powellomyces hirtus]
MPLQSGILLRAQILRSAFLLL